MMKRKLQHTNKAEVNRNIVLIESNPTKMNRMMKKVPLQFELNIQLKGLEIKFDVLAEENKSNLLIIKNLKQQAEELKNETPEKYKKIKKNQTQAKFTVISCIECIFAFLG